MHAVEHGYTTWHSVHRLCWYNKLSPTPEIYRAATTTDDQTIPVNCTGDGWRYFSADGAAKTDLTYPDSSLEATNTEVSFDGLFNATGEGDLVVSEIPESKAVAVSDSLFGNTIELDLTCSDGAGVVDVVASCVQFMVNFTNNRYLSSQYLG